MDGFTMVDGIVALIVFISAILAYSRGLVREILSIIGWIAAAIIAFVFAPQAVPLINEIPLINDIIGASCELAIIVGFAAVFAIALIIVSIFTPIFSNMIQNTSLGKLDQGLGFIFGIIRGIILVVIGLVAYTYVGAKVEWVDNSKTKVFLASSQEKMQDMIPTEAPVWIVNRYEDLTVSCGQPVETETDNTQTETNNGETSTETDNNASDTETTNDTSN